MKCKFKKKKKVFRQVKRRDCVCNAWELRKRKIMTVLAQRALQFPKLLTFRWGGGGGGPKISARIVLIQLCSCVCVWYGSILPFVIVYAYILDAKATVFLFFLIFLLQIKRHCDASTARQWFLFCFFFFSFIRLPIFSSFHEDLTCHLKVSRECHFKGGRKLAISARHFLHRMSMRFMNE